MSVVAVRMSDPAGEGATPLDDGSALNSTCGSISISISTRPHRGTHHRPIALTVKLFDALEIHPSATIDQIAKDVDKGFLDHLLAANDRLGVPAKGGQRALGLLHLLGHLGVVSGPGGDRGRDRGAELQGGVQRHVAARETGIREIIPAEGGAFRGARGAGALGEVKLELLFVGCAEAAKAHGLELAPLEVSEAPEAVEAEAGAKTKRVVVLERRAVGTGVGGVERAGARAEVGMEGRGEVHALLESVGVAWGEFEVGGSDTVPFL